MEYVYGALLLHSAGKEINEEAMTKVLEGAGIDVDKARVKALIASLKDVDIEEAISKTAVAATPAAAAAPAAAPAAGEAPAEDNSEEEEEKGEEEAASGLASLFG